MADDGTRPEPEAASMTEARAVDAEAIMGDVLETHGIDAQLVQEIQGLAPVDAPHIQAKNRQLPDISRDAVLALVKANDPMKLFTRDGLLTRVERDEDGRRVARVLGRFGLRSELARSAHWVTLVPKGEEYSERSVPPPMDVVDDILNTGEPPPGIPALAGTADCPILVPGGRIVVGPGYDAESRWMVASSVEPTPFHGSGADAAAWILREIFGDFMFDSEASRCHALALLLLPFVRPYIDGCTPNHLVDAPTPGTGKGLTVKVALLPGLGREPKVLTLPEQEESVDKLIFSLVLGGATVAFFDNIGRTVKSPSLEAAITAGTLHGRVLGVSEVRSGKANQIWCSTSNHGRLSLDLARRSILIREDARVEAPDLRSDWRHHDLIQWVKRERARIVGAVLKMIETWLAEGAKPSTKRKGSFDEWTACVGGILESCDVPGFLDNERELKESAAEEEAAWRSLYADWLERFGTDIVEATQLKAIALENPAMGFIFAKSTSERSEATAFGIALGKRIGRVLDGLRPVKDTVQRGASRYRLEVLVGKTEVHHYLGSNGEPVDINPYTTRENERDGNTHAQDGEGVYRSEVHHSGSNSGEPPPSAVPNPDPFADDDPQVFAEEGAVEFAEGTI